MSCPLERLCLPPPQDLRKAEAEVSPNNGEKLSHNTTSEPAETTAELKQSTPRGTDDQDPESDDMDSETSSTSMYNESEDVPITAKTSTRPFMNSQMRLEMMPRAKTVANVAI